MTKKYLILFLLFLISSSFYTQTDNLTRFYRNEPKGDIQYRRESIMNGNRVRTLFDNVGQIGHWPNQPSGEWPSGSGHSYEDGICVLIAAEVTAPGTGQKIHPLETYYREWVDKDPVTGALWTLTPVPGYANPQSIKPAISGDPKSWPLYWPDKMTDLNDPGWAGKWSGYFGKGITNSDFETFFIMDDSKDKEFTRLPFLFFPIAADSDRGGLGIRVETRGFQWSHVLAENLIFWHFDIINISDNDYSNASFGLYTDPGVGGTNDSGDDCASFDTKLDIAYAFDGNGKGLPDGWATGMYGYAYLESPGNGSNGKDDDEDGLVDERRDDGIDNDHDWIGFSDLNGDGKWNPELHEPLNDDVGLDGIGPLDEGYTLPDQGEGDGLPTSGAYPVATEFPGEPNVDKTDKDESDQIGLTAVSIYRLGDGGVGGGWPKDDETMWMKMVAGTFDTSLQNSNISMVFASGPFPLFKNKRERFSMALMFGNNLEDLIFNKETVQQIYNANYNFSKPPSKPKLTAVPGDGAVYLFWDNKAEASVDKFLGYQDGDPTKGYKKDFEGYLIYKSTESAFNDAKIITDSKGNPKYWKPLAQFDLKDGIKGPDPVGINGARFWRGEDNSLQHSFKDTLVNNGQRYYYALVSYDMGDPNYGTKGLQPTECTKIINEDFAGTIQFIDINCAVITPNAPATGYVPAGLQNPESVKRVEQGLGTGNIKLDILDPAQILAEANYKVTFNSTGEMPKYKTSTFEIHRMLNGKDSVLIAGLDTSNIGSGRPTPVFDGMSVTVNNDTTILPIPDKTNWIVGKSNINLVITADNTSRGMPWPNDYQIEFFDTPQDTGFINAPAQLFIKMPVNLKITNLYTGKKNKIAIKDMDGTGTLTFGDEIQILEFIGTQTVGNSRIAWKVGYNRPADPGAAVVEPVLGDKFQIKISKQFLTGDYFSFALKAPSVDNAIAKTQLSNISVVPNPYLGAAIWERKNLNSTGRGERKIDFINLPDNCTIRIYTMAGALIKTLRRGYTGVFNNIPAIRNDKESNSLDGALSWNLVSEDGMDVAYGVYIYHVDAPGIGEHIGKFAVIK
ncbi:MAG: hypothetical protein NTX22_11990 [Ignavibacteriales bacterium]|nr:hypothetical protein [Ignavibacteriales bacterium]